MPDPTPTPPNLWAFVYDRVFVHWKSTACGLAGTALVVTPVLASNGFNGRAVTLVGALALAIVTALSKD